MSDKTFVDFPRWRRPPLIQGGVGFWPSKPPFSAVFAPFSTVYREARQPENAVGPTFWRIDRQKRRLKTVETGVSAVAAVH